MKPELFLSIVSACAVTGVQAQECKRPNIILLMADQQRGDAMHCAGNDAIITPNLDGLARDGYRFSHAFSACPSSTPARAGLLTGMSPWHHGMLGYGKVAEHYRYEMPQMLRDNGYLTIGLGKMHWSPQNALHGFHVTMLDESGRVESPYFCSDYRKWFMTQAPGLSPDSTGIGWNDHGAKVYQLPERLHPTVWTADMAVNTINNFSGDKPLFLKVSFARPHSPYDPPERLLRKYSNIAMPKAAHGEWSCKTGEKVTDPVKNHDAAYGQFGEDYVDNSRRHYYASVTFVDEQIGRIVEALKEKNMYDNTLILFTSDHGDMLGDHNMWRKTYAYQGSSSIPMIVKPPKGTDAGTAPGSVVENPVELRDVLPTFLDACGDTVPADMDGSSLLTLIRDPRANWRCWIEMEHATCYYDDNYWTAITDGHVKYIWFLRTGKEQLFDLDKDSGETIDLSKVAEYSNLLVTMRGAMAQHLSERGEEWVKDGELQQRESTLLYSPNYPK